jgi:hypothetical protein
VKVKRIYELIESRKLQAVNVSTGEKRPRWRIDESELERFEKARRRFI